VLLVLLAHLRLHTTAVACIAVALTALAGIRRVPPSRTLAVVAAVTLTPIFLGLGPLGVSFITDNAGSIGSIRSSNARGDAAIAGATTTIPVGTTTSPGAGRPPQEGPSPGVEPGTADGGMRSIRYLPRGLFALLVEPLPWRHGNLSLRLAALESIVWYPLLALAGVGLTVARRHLDRFTFPILMGAGSLCMWALIEGNIGTAYRHRGEFAWVVCLLAVLGVQRLRPHLAGHGPAGA
jgi:hypothetical protein